VRWCARKKNADEKPGAPSQARAGHELAAHYEVLRRAVLEAHEGSHPVRARALLMHKGMAAWMSGIEAGSARAAAPRVAGAERPLPVGTEQHLVDILATMALATTAIEVVT
jgi:hypothetical protein